MSIIKINQYEEIQILNRCEILMVAFRMTITPEFIYYTVYQSGFRLLSTKYETGNHRHFGQGYMAL